MAPKGKYKGRGGGYNAGANRNQSLASILAEGDNTLLAALGVSAAAPVVGTEPRQVTLQATEVAALQKLHQDAAKKKKVEEQTELLTLVQKTLGLAPGGQQAQKLQEAVGGGAAPATPAATEKDERAGTKRKTTDEDDNPKDTDSDEPLSRSAKQRLKFREKVTAQVRAESLEWELECMRLREEKEQAQAREKLMREKGFNTFTEKNYFSDSDAQPSTRSRARTSNKSDFNKLLKEATEEVRESPDRAKARKAIADKEAELSTVREKIKQSPKASQVSTKSVTSKLTSTSKKELRGIFSDMLQEFGVIKADAKAPGAATAETVIQPEVMIETEEDDICAFVRVESPETKSTVSDPPPFKGKKKKKKPTALQGPFVVLNEVLLKCDIPKRTVRPGQAFRVKYQSVVDKLTSRLVKIDGVQAQFEALLHDTHGYGIGSRNVSDLAMELIYITEKSNVKIPAKALK